MSEPEWMHPPKPRLKHEPLLKDKQTDSYLSWPQNAADSYNIPSGLEGILQKRQGTQCRIVQYSFEKSLFERNGWHFDRATKSLHDIKDMVSLDPLSEHKISADRRFFLASALQDQTIRLLGYWMRIPPHFFALPTAHVRVITGDDYLMFSLQYMKKCRVGHQPSGPLPHCRFRDKTGHRPHEWHVDHIRMIFLTRGGRIGWQGLYMFDEGDDYIATKLRDWLVGLDREAPHKDEVYCGLGQVIQDVIYILSNIRTEFLDEALEHLQVLSSNCLAEDLDPEKQLEYMRELYQLSPLWSQVRRQLDGTKNLIAQVSRHKISCFQPNWPDPPEVYDNRYYVKRLSVIEDQLRRCEDAVDRTKNLINLILGIASLQESRAAVRESRAANDFTSSIQRITILTFIYLPLTLASSILGMNITQVTGEVTHSQLWVYFAIAIALMAATFGGWYIWSLLLLPEVKQRIKRKAAIQAAAAKGA